MVRHSPPSVALSAAALLLLRLALGSGGARRRPLAGLTRNLLLLLPRLYSVPPRCSSSSSSSSENSQRPGIALGVPRLASFVSPSAVAGPGRRPLAGLTGDLLLVLDLLLLL